MVLGLRSRFLNLRLIDAIGCRLLSNMLPKGNRLPTSRDKARRYVTSLGGLDYDRIHACVNDCILFRGTHKEARYCPTCGEARYRTDVKSFDVPRKVLRHFPIIPRIKHMFKCKSIAELMSWHSSHRSDDGMWRIPADTPAWKHIEDEWPSFKTEPRNLRLGLGMDGVNPFGFKSTAYSVWPVVLVNYNLPPSMAIKKGHLMLSLLIPGKHKVKHMDVYLEPLIDELEELWRGVTVMDISRSPSSRHFDLKAVLMWTMHDFLGYSDCFGKNSNYLPTLILLAILIITIDFIILTYFNRFENIG